MCIRPRPAGHRIQRLPRHEQDGAAGCRLHRSGGVRRDSGAGDGRTPARRVNTYFHGRLSGEVFVTLIVIMDPLGTIPLFLGLTSGRSARVRRRLAGQAVVVAGLVISTFAVFGQQILTYLGIGVPALQGAGTPIPRYVRICWPKTANVEITRPATTTACPARRRRTRALRPLVKPRNSGIVPNGSMMTISVTKTSPDSRPWK